MESLLVVLLVAGCCGIPLLLVALSSRKGVRRGADIESEPKRSRTERDGH